MNPRGVSARAVIIGLLLTPLNVFFLVKSIWMWGGFTGSESLFANTIGLLFLHALLNQWLRRRRPTWAFSPGEMLTIYLMLGMSTGLVSSVWDLGGALSGYITYPFWFATDSNEWRELLWPNLPIWLTIQDRSVLEGFYMGRADPYRWGILKAWAGPAFWWACLVGSLMWVCLCLNSIVRRRWADEEKLPFPMTILPVQLVDERGTLLRDKLFLLAVAISAGLGTWTMLASIAPSLPSLPLGIDYTQYVENNRPWNFIRHTSLQWRPWALGLCYLIPLDLALSLFVFDLLWTAEYVVSGHLGWCISKWSGFPYGEQQTAGGFIALAVAAFWLDRAYLVQVLRRAVGMRSVLQEAEPEAFGYRVAVLGCLAGLGFLWWLLARAGMPTWVIWSFLPLYFVMCLVISRLRAQLGPPTHQLYGAMPNWILPTVAGTRALGPRTMGMFFLLRPFLQEQRNHPAPLQLEALKMAEGGRMERPRIALALAVVAPLAILCYFWATIHIGYRLGLGTADTQVWQLNVPFWGTEWLESAVRDPAGFSSSGTIAIGFGMVFTLALYFLKLRFQWWPLHPVAFPIAIASTIQSMTPVIFAAWLVKALLLRYGGLRAHRTALPFFLGLLVGDATTSLLRAVLFELLDIRVGL